MQIKVQCSCGKTFVTSDANAGKRTKCSNCGSVLQIPAASAAPQSAPPAGQPPVARPAAPKPRPAASPLADLGDLNVGGPSQSLWTDEDFTAPPKAPVVEAHSNPYQSPTSAPARRRSGGSDKSFFARMLTFEGRIPRSTYWAYQGIFLAVGIVAAVLAETQVIPREALAVVQLICFVPSLAIQVQRCHDLDKSGWFLLLNLVPCVGPLVTFIYLGCIAGTSGRNSYGPDPLGG